MDTPMIDRTILTELREPGVRAGPEARMSCGAGHSTHKGECVSYD
jgi:hypothetical protein